MKILITGATGLIGRELVEQCNNDGISVHYFTTRKKKIEDRPNYRGFYWNPLTNEIDIAAFEGVSAIINLAGANIGKRWTKSYKAEIFQSRTQPADLIFETLKELDHSISHFISASGISVYPRSETNLYTEESIEVDDTFLAEVVKVWEAIYIHILKNELEGVYNAVAPNPVTNRKLNKQIAAQTGAPLWLPKVPPFVLKLLLGEMAILALEGQLVSSRKLELSGYSFKYPNIELACADLLEGESRNK
jgi:NAD dependent epimerase/dehydratase family enzyme